MVRISVAFRVQIVFGHEAIFVHAKIPRDGAEKAAIKDTARQLVPALVFDGFKEARINACGGGDLLQGDTAHLPFALEMFAEGC